MPGAGNKLVRHGYKLTVGGYLKPPTSKIVEAGATHHATHLSTQRAGKPSWKGMLGIHGEKHTGEPDPVKFIKKFDAQNTSGAIKEGLDIMEKLKANMDIKDLTPSIEPLKSILGGSLYGALQSAGATASSAGKIQKVKEEAIVPVLDMLNDLIQAALDCAGPDAAAEAAELLDDAEIAKINTALDSNGRYTSSVMPPEFVACINKLIPMYYSIQVGQGIA